MAELARRPSAVVELAIKDEASADTGSDPNADTYEIESAKVKAPVKKGQYLAINASETSMLRCSSGGDNILLYQPALDGGAPFAPQTSDDGCWLRLQAKIK